MMDKDRVKGSADQVKGALKEAAGDLTGDAKLKAEGKADNLKGKVENAVGGAKDAVKEAAKKLNHTLDRAGIGTTGSAVRHAVRTRPLEAVALAAGIGAMVGALIRRV